MICTVGVKSRRSLKKTSFEAQICIQSSAIFRSLLQGCWKFGTQNLWLHKLSIWGERLDGYESEQDTPQCTFVLQCSGHIIFKVSWPEIEGKLRKTNCSHFIWFMNDNKHGPCLTGKNHVRCSHWCSRQMGRVKKSGYLSTSSFSGLIKDAKDDSF